MSNEFFSVLKSRPYRQAATHPTGRPQCWVGACVAYAAGLALLFLWIPGNAFGRQVPEATERQATPGASSRKTENENLPQVPPPKFRVFKFGTDVSTAYVVPGNTTDEQLKSLLWFFRRKVRAGDFKAIGIRRPTTMQYGHFGYEWGRLVVYKREKCADENYLSDGTLGAVGIAGPCGYGEHGDAIYQWGIGDDPHKDSGSIRAKNGGMEEIFSYKDDWRPSS